MDIKCVEKSLKVISDEGIITFFKKALKSAATKIFRVNSLIIFELDIESPVRKIFPSIELSFAIASEEEIDSMDEEHYGYDEKGKQYSKDRLKKGDKCILAVYGGKITGYLSAMKDNMELSQLNHIPLHRNRAYLYKGFVLEEFRGKRVLNALVAYMINTLKKDGKSFLVYTVAKDNKPSIKATERMGFKRVGQIIQVKLFGLRYDYISRMDLEYIQGK